MLSEQELKENHEKCLELMDRFVAICEKNNIVYYFAEGSAIGVLRHKGFIPWDINIDVYMTYDEYIRLNHIMKQEKLAPFRWCMPRHAGRICGCLMREDSFSYKTVPNIDISLIGAAPNNKLLRDAMVLITYLNYRMFKLKNTKVKRRFPFNILKGITYILPNRFYFFVLRKFGRIKDKKNTKFFVNITPGWYGKREIMRKNWLGTEKVYGEFEGRKVRIMRNCDAYLRNRYGDYMKPDKWENKGEYKGVNRKS